MKIAQAPLAAAPSASAISTMPAAIATGKVPAWIHPRHVGLISAFALTSAANVRTLALVEVLFARILSARLFREGTSLRQLAGIVLIVAGVVLLIRVA